MECMTKSQNMKEKRALVRQNGCTENCAKSTQPTQLSSKRSRLRDGLLPLASDSTNAYFSDGDFEDHNSKYEAQVRNF